MIKKVLIAEDYESTNISIQKTLEELGLPPADYVYYCDDAFLKIQKAKQAGASYDLLITDLYFDKDHRDQNLTDGSALIAAARREQPDLKILVFSAEHKPAIIKPLFDEQEINGYVRKARGDVQELKKAFYNINARQLHYPLHLMQQTRRNNTHEFTPLDIAIVLLMTEGKRQQEIAADLKKNKIQPSSLSSIEKRLTLMKEALNFSTNEQLIAHCVKMGIV